MVFWAALAAVAVPTVVSFVLTAVNGWDRTSTISRHVAKRPATAAIFAVTETSANLVLAWYVWAELFLGARLWLVTCLLVTAIQVLVVIAALVPHTTGWRVRVHQLAAWRAVALCFILAYLLLLQASLHKVGWLIGVTAAYVGFMTGSLLLYHSNFLARNWLFAEFGVFIGFGVAVLAFGLAPLSPASATSPEDTTQEQTAANQNRPPASTNADSLGNLDKDNLAKTNLDKGNAPGTRPAPQLPPQSSKSPGTASAQTALSFADWATMDEEGGLSLMVVPAPWVRQAISSGDIDTAAAALEQLWDELTAVYPEADTATMRNQFTCHALGAPDKDSWNLEPWRPDVGLADTIAALCNPVD